MALPMIKKHIRSMLIIIILAVSLGVGACVYIQHPKFGELPDGKDRNAISRSPHYIDAEFRNLVSTPILIDESGFFTALLNSLFTRKDRPRPAEELPTVKTDLKALDANIDTIVWLGHSSYYVQIAGKRILIDPVFSAYAAPVPFANRAFTGTSIYTANDMPEIDYLLITHDHWDHLDYASVRALEPKVQDVICGLGVGGYFRQWGYASGRIHEADWYGMLELEPGLTIHILPARHYSGRMLTRNKTLWVGFALAASDRKLFFSGDSGYGPHFEEIGRALGGFDLAVLDMGQYNQRWPYIHMNPEEAAKAAEDLRAKALLPAHVGRFSMARHSWDEPFRRIVDASAGRDYHLLLPLIGESVSLDAEGKAFRRWWEEME